MKELKQRFKAMSGWQKAGLVVGLPIVAAVYICMSPIILLVWGISSVSDLFDGSPHY